MKNQLPIEEILPLLLQTLRANTSAVLVAPPGAGKTTRVPLALLDEPWLAGKKIIMLEPRRLAARMAARYMAGLLGEPVGASIGYRVRSDTRVSSQTRIEVITEGILTRMLQSDPALEEIGAVILDEFHERSLDADIGLAFLLQSQTVLRPDLRILVMSATMEAQAVANLLGGAHVLISSGRQFPVTTHYWPMQPQERLETAVIRTIRTALTADEGDILAFLPGVGEIRRIMSGLQQLTNLDDIDIYALYGSMPYEEQDRAIAPSLPGRRKIVLATSVAETSLTVQGVRIVIDSGLMRVPRFSARTGMTRLATIPVSRASADQRRGRAARLGPGVCYRLWSEWENEKLIPCSTPEIREADLAALALELAVWGVKDAAELCWLDQPPPAALQTARQLLEQLGALRADGTVTEHGHHMAKAGIHPRLSHMILKGKERGNGALACYLAAVLGERSLKGDAGLATVDIRARLDELTGEAGRRIQQEAALLMRQFHIDHATLQNEADIGLLLAFAYPERIAQRRPDGRYLLLSGRGAVLGKESPELQAPYLVAAELADQGVDSRIYLAAPIEYDAIIENFGEHAERLTVIRWERESQAVKVKQVEMLGSLILKETPLASPDPQLVLTALIEGIRLEGLSILPWSRSAVQLLERMRFMQLLEPDWPAVTDEILLETLEEWLAPYLTGIYNRSGLQQLPLTLILQSMLSWRQRQQLEEDAPTHIEVPSGQRIPVDYSNPEAPVLAVRLQEMFGLLETPHIGGGRVPLVLHLLSPARRPVQVTRDLASFWQGAYHDVRKDLQGRYPKHYWPEDPIAAQATHRAKPRT